MKIPGLLRNRRAMTILICFLIGALWILALRFALIQRNDVHFHANFAVYADGQRLEFDNFTFYEEVQACGGDELNNPRTRVHMHDQIDHVVHVHDNAATWGHFFANLGMGLSPGALETEDSLLVDNQNGKKLTFWLNGKEVGNTYNTPIKTEDVLLIDYGSADPARLQQEYDSIAKDAGEYNRRKDPSACTGGKELTLSERLEKTLKFWE